MRQKIGISSAKTVFPTHREDANVNNCKNVQRRIILVNLAGRNFIQKLYTAIRITDCVLYSVKLEHLHLASVQILEIIAVI